jgi:hypothetical protein
MCEMDKYDYQIPRVILEKFIDLQITKDAIQNKIKEQSR